MTQIVLIRPGCTTFDEQQRMQGMLDLPLSPLGEQQFAKLARSLSGVDLDLIYASPSEPALACALQLGALRGVPVKPVDGLHNVNLGLWQGLQMDEIRRKHPKVFKQWQESPESICPPDGESFADAQVRVRQALEKPLRKRGNLGIVASSPLASLVSAVVRGVPLGSVERACSSECGCYEVLRENTYKSLTGEFPAAAELATARPA